MNIDTIQNGMVIDHIPAGKSMHIWRMLGFDRLDCPVAMIMNAHSGKMGKKDIVKIDGIIDLNMDVISYVAPDSTINIIRDGAIVEKYTVTAPACLVNILRCKNPRCITTTERDIKHIFNLTNPAKREYRCHYCETLAKEENLY